MTTSESTTVGRWQVFLLLGTGCCLRVIFFCFSQNNGGDAFARVSVLSHWLEHPTLGLYLAGPTWPPLHFWLMALLAQIVPDLMLAGRLLSLIAGLFSVWLFWRVAQQLYGDQTAVLSLAVFTFYSLHIAYSTTSSSEASFIAFILAGLWGVFSFRTSGSYPALLAGGLSLTGAAAIRFEGWIVIFALGLCFLVGQEARPFPSAGYGKALLGYGITSGIWPILWSIQSTLKTGNPVYFLSDNRASIPGQLAGHPEHGTLYELGLFPGVILLTLTVIGVIGVLYGLARSIRKKKNLDFVFLLMFVALFQLGVVTAKGSLALARYTLLIGTLCAIVAGYGLEELGDRVFAARREATLYVLTGVMAVNLAAILAFSEKCGAFENKFRSVSPLMQFPVHVEEVAKVVRPRLKPTDRILIDNYNDEPNILGAAFGLPVKAGDRVFFASARTGSDPFPYLNAQRPRFAILSSRGLVGSHLDLPNDCRDSWIVRDMAFQCIFANDLYQVYVIRYPPTSGTGSS